MSETVDQMRQRFRQQDLARCGFIGAVTGVLDLAHITSPDDMVARLHILRARYNAEMAALEAPAEPMGPTP